MSKKNSQPVMENRHVKEVLAVMDQHHSESMKNISDVIGYVSELEKQLSAATSQLAVMRQELDAMKPGPVKKTMQNAVIVMQDQVLTLRDRLAALKDQVVEGCKNLVAAFKEKGTQALSNAAQFFKLRPLLETLRKDLTASIQSDERIVHKIRSASREYHKAGQHIKNAGRAMVGMKPVPKARPPGPMAKGIEAPFKAERACLLSARKSVDNALERITRLEQAAEHRPSIRETMKQFEFQIANAPKSAPIREMRPAER